MQHLTVQFEDLRTNPAGQITQIVNHLGIERTDAQIASAIGHVRDESTAAA